MSPRYVLRQLTSASAVIAMLLVGCVASRGSSAAPKSQQTEFLFHSPVPLGSDTFRLEPANENFYLLASVENSVFDGMRVKRVHMGGSVTRADGAELDNYPDVLNFRVTASSIEEGLDSALPWIVNSHDDLNKFLLGLRFRLKIYRGLKMHVVKPENVKLIGVPSDQPFNERIYRVSFDTSNIPCDARMVLEVLSPSGERLTRFHLELL